MYAFLHSAATRRGVTRAKSESAVSFGLSVAKVTFGPDGRSRALHSMVCFNALASRRATT